MSDMNKDEISKELYRLYKDHLPLNHAMYVTLFEIIEQHFDKPKVGDVELERIAHELLEELGRKIVPRMTRVHAVTDVFKKLISQARPVPIKVTREWVEDE